MKINNLKINAFGKIKDKEIELSDGINILFGENEAGKSTIQKFILGMLYGLSKNKNGKDISDFEKYKPWHADEYSGKINYTLENGEKFEVYREFKKKNPVIYNYAKEDISKTFIIDKNKGIDYFTEQTGIDEETFYSTAITEQEGVKLSKSSQNSIVQKISNLVSSGDDSISYKKSLEKINRRQNEEIGSGRTSQRPINIIENKIYRLQDQKRNLESYREKIEYNTNRKEKLILDQEYQEAKRDFLKSLKTELDNNRLKTAEINFNKNLENEYNKKIQELNSKISNNKNKKEDLIEKPNNTKYYVVLAIFVIVFILLMIFNRNHVLINFVFLIPAIYLIYDKVKNSKIEHVVEVDEEKIKEKIINEIEVLKQNKEIKRKEAEEKQEKLDKEIEEDKKRITEEYIKILDIDYIDRNLNKNYDEILKEIDKKENRINTIKFELQTIDNTIKNINEKLENLSKIEEELQEAETERQELYSLNNSYNIVKECIERAYRQVKENISPKFMTNLCDIISKISNKRYTNIVLNDDEGLNVEIKNGNYVPVSRLSVGTVDQMYISLRLSALREVSTERMPIILDEAFAYFDEDRLENMLKYISSSFKKNQIIIFTCSQREENSLKRLGIEYNMIKI